MAYRSAGSRIFYSLDPVFEGKIYASSIRWPDDYEEYKYHTLFKVEKEDRIHLYRCIDIVTILTKSTKNKTLKSEVELFAGKEIVQDADSLSEMFDTIRSYAKGAPELPQQSVSTAFCTVLDLENAISKELERSLEAIRGPFLSKMVAGSLPAIPIKVGRVEDAIMYLIEDLNKIPSTEELHNLQFVYNQSIKGRYLSGEIPSGRLYGKIPYGTHT